jgi:signal transduction histidine kinase
VQLTTATGPVWARANLARLRQVLRALIDNALKHTPAAGRVAVEAAARALGRGAHRRHR